MSSADPRGGESISEKSVPEDCSDAASHKKAGRIKGFALKKTPKKLKNPTDIQVRFRTGFVYIAISVICILVNDITMGVFLAAPAGI
ncbi:MAG: phosphatidate cytidylyltransferase, partial [Raoultibacter sp.]